MDKLVFRDTCVWYRIFLVVKVLSVIATSCLYPYMIAFVFEDENNLITISNVFEFVFLVDICLNFCKHKNNIYELEDHLKPANEIAEKYLKSTFIYDFIAILPLQLMMKLHDNNQMYFLYIKLFRLK